MTSLAEPGLIDRPTAGEALRAGFRRARAAGPVRHRDVAAALGVSEAELLAAHMDAPEDGLRAWPLRSAWGELLKALPALGEVMALTRNDSCVHEKVGTYEDVQAEGDAPAMGLVLGPDIDLRVFFSAWSVGFAVHERVADGSRPDQLSLQFFDASGAAVHKIFARPGRTQAQAWQALVERFAMPAAALSWRVQPAASPPPPRADHDVDAARLREGWASLRDTHDFFGLLRRHGVTRTQAFRLADARFAQAVEPGAVRTLLEGAAQSSTPLMVFVGNPGMIQIHTGPVRRVQVMGPWLNVLDPGFNLHLREDHVHEAWVVRKPTRDGLVTSLEVFDRHGETVAMFFGERKPGRSELPAWRQLVASVVNDAAWMDEGHACAAC
jgi:putative hemin transport protein